MLISKHEKWMAVLFLLTLPLVNPWVRGDGVGYYAYARALLIEHRLDFQKDWLAANTSFRLSRVDENGRLKPQEYTSTGHIDNYFSVGPAILWSPFLIVTHIGVLIAGRLGSTVPADGFSWPYVDAMAVSTALYGFLGLLLSYRLACKYFEERWALLATLGIWFGSSLPVYMYFNPSWSHAHSAFVVALFIFYWDRTRPQRTMRQWLILGLFGGLMVEVYYPNSMFLLIPAVELVRTYWSAVSSKLREHRKLGRLVESNLVFVAAGLVAFLPTIVTRRIIYGGFFSFGDYGEMPWSWSAPAALRVLFSSDHGLISWTPILGLAILGLVLWVRVKPAVGGYFLLACAGFYYLISCYPDWDGLSAFGGRFFVSLTPLFIVGLAAFIDACAKAWRSGAMPATARATVACLVLWNFGLMFQWGMHMIPVRGPISFRQMAYGQVAGVPVRLSNSLAQYLTGRKSLMNDIEKTDVKQLEHQTSGQPDPEARGYERP